MDLADRVAAGLACSGCGLSINASRPADDDGLCPMCVASNIAEADRALGYAVRAIYERGLVLSMSKGAEGSAFIMLDGVLQPRTPTLDDAVRKALEAK